MIENTWHLRGSTTLPPDATDEAVIERLECFLTKQHKPITGQSVSAVQFDSPLWQDWFTPSWLALVIYDRGVFWIEAGLNGRKLRYDLRSLHGLIYCLAGALMFLMFVSSFEGIAAGVRFAFLAFMWLYGGNMVLAWARIPLAIRKAVNGS
ncbi:MAG: hypothetical protein AAGK17_13630 [Pseudomonadota bacterium]